MAPRSSRIGTPLIRRDMKGLKTIGIEWDQAWPAAEFWERYHKGEFK